MTHSRRASLTQTRFQLERLEERALLSSLAYSLTTNESSYQPGQPIQISLTVTNTSSQPIETLRGADLDHFVVTENGVQVWESGSFILPLAESVTLQPGQSFTDGDTWNGVPNLGPLGAPTVLMGGLFTLTDQSVPGAGSANFTIDSPLSYSITTDQYTYSVGQPIEITYTQTNTSSQPVTANTGPSDFTINQAGQSAPVANLPGTWTTQSPTTTLQPGQSISETATWNGVANVGSQSGANVLGSDITVSDSAAPQPLTAGFQITNPIETGLTVTSSSFAAGDPVTLLYTATNSGDVPVTVLNSPGSFSIQEELQLQYPEVFSQTGSGTGTLVTLQPGQSLTQSATWTPSGGQAPVGSYQAYYSGPFDGKWAIFQVGAPGSISTTFTTDKSDYSVGQPVQITLSETNTSNQPVTVNTGPSEFQITGETLAADVSGTGGTQSSTETLLPGQSFTQTATWNGVVGNIGTNPGTTAWGSFAVSSQNASQLQFATFQIAKPVTTSLVASSPTFAPGQPVTLTFTETNSADVPVTVADYSGSFEIDDLETSAAVFCQTGSATPTLVTVQPGASLTQTATWTPSAGQAPAGSYSAGYSDPTQGVSTTFQIGSSNDPLPSAPAGVVASLATARSVVRLGQPMAFTLTLSNESNHTVDVSPKKKTGSVTIYHGSQAVWQSSKLTLRGHKTIAAGHSVKLRGVSSGNGSERLESRLAPGTYTIAVSYDGYSASEMIQVKG
jgi:hypothetical protein